MKKFTLSLLALIVCATTFAQTPINTVADIKPGKLYWFDNAQIGGWWEDESSSIYFDKVFGDRLCSSYFSKYAEGRETITNNVNDPLQQFAFIECDNKMYLYSVGADNFVTLKDNGAFIMDAPTSYVTVTGNTCTSIDGYPWNIAFDGDSLLGIWAHTFTEPNGYVYAAGDDRSNRYYAWQIYEVGEMSNLAEVTERLANNMKGLDSVLEAAQDSLMYAYEAAEEFLSDIDYYVNGNELIELQANTPEDANYIWCNEPEESEGSILGLLDDDETTYFHTCWTNTTQSEHWLQVDLSVPLKDFCFIYQTRHNGGANFPTAIEVKGSNDGEEFESIAYFDEDLPQSAGFTWKSSNINAEKEYKHLRFVVYAPNIYWHMAKFELRTAKSITVDEKYLPYTDYLDELIAAIEEGKEFLDNNPNAKAEEYYAYTDNINNLLDFIKKLASGERDENTLPLIEEAEALYAIEGVGYPGPESRAAYRAVIDNAISNPTTQAGLDLVAAKRKYIESHEVELPKSGEKYTITFITTQGRRNFLNVDTYNDGDFEYYTLSMVQDNITSQGQSLPESAVFTCLHNEDGTFEFVTAKGKFLGIPDNEASSGSESGLYDYQTYFTVVKMYPNDMCKNGTTYDELFGLVSLCGNGLFMAPTSSGSIFYTDDVPNYTVAWTSAMKIEAWTPGDDTGIEEVKGENGKVKGVYDLQGRKVENPSTGIYIVDGKKVLVK